MAIRMSGLASGLDTESIVKELMSAQRMKATKIENKITKLKWKKEKWSTLNTKLYSFYTSSLSKLKMQGNYSTKKVSSSNNDKVEVTARVNAPVGTHTVKVTQMASPQFVTGSTEIGIHKNGTDYNGNAITAATKLTDLGFEASAKAVITAKIGDTTQKLVIDDTTTVNDFLKTLTKAGLNASYDIKQNRFFISSKESGMENAFSITVSDDTPEGTDNKLELLGLCDVKYDGTNVSVTDPAKVKLVEPKDAEIIYNGVKLTGSSNTITANGLTFTVKGETAEDETVSLNVTNDTQAVYDMVKDFVKNYNELLKEMNEDYDADTTRGYDPLTDEQKKVMTDEEVEKWEDKIKDSLLRRDSNMSSLLNIMKSAISGGYRYPENGKKYALVNFGIEAADYKEDGLLHIDGDKDEIKLSAKENKLMEALSEDPEKVMSTLSQMAAKMYSDFAEKMKGSNYNSALTLYNDKEIGKTIKAYKSDLNDMEDKLSNLEKRYYKQFTALEVAMEKMNSQTSALSTLLGTN
jgi:flagellar hook-associated protein 2